MILSSITRNSSTPKDRVLLLDFLKFFFIIPIVIFHTNESIFGSNIPPILENTWLYKYILNFAEMFSFSGQSIVALFCFLIGYRELKMEFFRRLFLILILGYLFVFYVYF